MKVKFAVLSALLVILIVLQVVVSAQTTTTGQVFYVSRRGSNGDGRTWATAWNELNQIRWASIQPGATIFIDGGSTSMQYNTTLTVGKSGTGSAPIRIRRSLEAGRNGQVIFFGGRTTNLPYCNQSSYTNPTGMRDYGIRLNGQDHIIIDGGRWRGIKITGFRINGIRFEAASDWVSIHYVEVYNNGDASRGTSGWVPNHAGIRLAGANVLIRRSIIRDNGQDAIQSLNGANRISNFRLEQSWLYNSRRHPTVNESWNYCTHTDGIQIYDGGTIRGITVTETIFGPGFTQNVLLGQTTTSSGAWAAVQNVTFRDVVFSRGADNGVMGYRNTNSQYWLLERVTIDCRNTKSHCLHIENSSHTVRYSVVVNGLITFPDGLGSKSNNCDWTTRGLDIGPTLNPLFASVSTTNMMSIDNYRVTNTSCTGSRMASAAQLLALR